MPIPVRAPPSDAVQRARDAADVLIELEHRRDVDHRDLQELRDLLCRPHFKVTLEMIFDLNWAPLDSFNIKSVLYKKICMRNYNFSSIIAHISSF